MADDHKCHLIVSSKSIFLFLDAFLLGKAKEAPLIIGNHTESIYS